LNKYKKIASKSVLEKKFIQALEDKKIKVISFDIFETLVFRDVNHPSDIFRNVGEHQFVKKIFDHPDTFKNFRIQAEKKARTLNSKLEDIRLKLIYEQLALTKKEQKKIISLELEEEYKSLYINYHVENWIRLAEKADKKVILTSDMYLLNKELKDLVISKLKNKKIISKIFVSNAYNATKSSGNLYPIVLKKMSIKPSQLLHIGDNKYADKEMAEVKGIKSIHYNVSSSTQNMFELEKNAINSLDSNNNYRIQASLLNPYRFEKEAFFFDLGATLFAPLLWEFSHWISAMAEEFNLSQVNCIMREGKIFKKYIKKVDKNLELNLIYASRKSTYLPSLHCKEIQKNGLNFYHYRQVCVQSFYDLFQLNIDDENIALHKNSLLKDANTIVIQDSNLLKIISKDIENRMGEIQKNIKREKKYFRQYLKQLNYKKESILIDFGGTGSILKNIHNANSNKQTMNVLFYTHASGFQNMLHDNLHTFLPYTQKTAKSIETIRRSHEIIEILFNGQKGTTLSYKKDKTKIVPITNSNNKHNAQQLKAFEKGIDSFFAICKKYKLQSNSFDREILVGSLTRVLQVPTLDEANYLGDLHHDENYQSTHIQKIITQKHLHTLTYNLHDAYYQSCNNPSFKITEIPWVQGAITQLKPEYISSLRELKSKGINTQAIDKIMQTLQQNNISSNIYVFGVGEFFKELYPQLKESAVVLKGLIDSRAKFSSFKSEGFKVKSLENVKLKTDDTIIISSAVFALEITQMIVTHAKTNSLNNIKIISQLDALLTIK